MYLQYSDGTIAHNVTLNRGTWELGMTRTYGILYQKRYEYRIERRDPESIANCRQHLKNHYEVYLKIFYTPENTVCTSSKSWGCHIFNLVCLYICVSFDPSDKWGSIGFVVLWFCLFVCLSVCLSDCPVSANRSLMLTDRMSSNLVRC